MVAIPKREVAVERATITSLYDGPIGTCYLDVTGKLVVCADDPTRQADLQRLIKRKYRTWQRRMEGMPFSPQVFWENITRWASGTVYTVVRPSRVDTTWLDEYLPRRKTLQPKSRGKISFIERGIGE